MQPRETPKCNMDKESRRQGLGRADSEGEMASESERRLRERRERRKKAREKADIRQGKGSWESSRELRGGRRS